MIVFTGLSGSGKSSLAFDTIFAEGQRRYVESLSAYARQFLGQMDKPDVDFIEGLSPAVSIDQKSTSKNPRSTVGTITEVYDYLRLLWARIGKPHCPICGEPITKQTPQQIVDRVLEMPEGTRFQVLAPGHPRAQGRVRRPVRRPAGQGLRPGPGRRRRPPAHRPADAEEAGEAHHRGGGRPAHASSRPASSGSPTRSRPRCGLAGGAGHPRLRRPRRRRPAPRAALLRAAGLPERPPAGHRRARAALVLVQLAVRRLPGLHRPRHPQGGRPGAGRPRPGAVAGRRRDRAVGHRADQRVLPAAAAGRRRRGRLRPATPRGSELPARARRRPSCTAPDEQVHVSYRNRYGRDRVLLRQLRGRRAVDRAPLRRDRQRLLAGEVRGLHARGAVPGLRGHPAQAGDPRGHRRRPVDRRGVRAVDRRGGRAGCAGSSSTTATG